MKWFVLTCAPLVLLCANNQAQADAPAHFGHGARSTALLRADLADADATSAPVQNAALAANQGARVRLGYMHGFLNLRIDDRAAARRDVAGIDAAAQAGFRLPA